MNNRKLNAVVRDPGTVFICWETIQDLPANTACFLEVNNITTGEVESYPVNIESGKHYLHSLNPDTYYHITIRACTQSGTKLEILLDFGNIHTFNNNISTQSSNNEEWKTDRESLLKLTGNNWEERKSSDGRYC